MTPLKIEFTSRIEKQYPAEAKAFLEAIDKEPRPSVRLHPTKGVGIGQIDEEATRVPWNRDGYWLKERPSYTLNPLFHVGAFYPQEASSMVLRHVIESVEGELPMELVVLDMCAAPGGKSTLMASWMDGKGLLVANEYVRQRAWILRENVAKWGYGNCMVTNCDSRQIADLGATFDLALVDAPCSGEGMFRKDDTARTEWTLENAAMCAERQKEIIENVWEAIVEGGIMIYSTCTFNPEENELQMEWMCKELGAECIDIKMNEEWNLTKLDFEGGSGYAFHPHKVDGEGFFVCAMRKTEGSIRRKPKLGKKCAWTASKENVKGLKGSYTYYNNGENIVALPRQHDTLMISIAESLKPLLMGVDMGKTTKKELIPAEELALKIDFDKSAYPIIEASKEEALRYLRGEWTYTGEVAQGWNVVSFESHPIGFVKVIGNRVNNYWPKEWRIRMDF